MTKRIVRTNPPKTMRPSGRNRVRRSPMPGSRVLSDVHPTRLGKASPRREE